MVLTKGDTNNSFYVLRGTTITGDVNMSKIKLNKTHLRLSHTSKKGLEQLAN